MFVTGYRMRINNSTEAANTGRLHVDYAQARDDQLVNEFIFLVPFTIVECRK